MESFPNDPTAAWSAGYLRLGALVGAGFFIVTLLVLWKSAIRAWGPFVGIVGGFIPIFLASAFIALVAGALWPVAIFIPLALFLARPSRDHAEHGSPRGQRSR